MAVAHLGAGVSPNFSDASLILATAAWVVAEIVRLSHKCDIETAQEIVGKSIPFFSTHMDLVQKMKEAKRIRAGESSRDNDWAEKSITEKTEELTSERTAEQA